jgi:2',3'-cyclic-nucleotide 2'-phosphodiesterase (5'-nucleotidase family)
MKRDLKMSKSARNVVLAAAMGMLYSTATVPLALAQQPAPKQTALSTSSQVAGSPDVHSRVSETLVDSSIPDDPGVDQMLATYSPKVRALEVVLGSLKGELKKSGAGAGSLGNFVADAMRAQTSLKQRKPIDLALMNSGGLRRPTIGEGELRARDIFELLPFENALVTIEVTGEQLLKLLQLIVTSREAESGARITYVIKADKTSELEKVKLLDTAGREKEIEPGATYTVVTIDYLYHVGGRYSILREGKNMTPLGITLRDAVMDYVRAETAAHRDIKPSLDGRFVLDRANSVLTEDTPPN